MFALALMDVTRPTLPGSASLGWTLVAAACALLIACGALIQVVRRTR